ncbi:unnamed protein product [Ilex paraguariensis]|uniref:Uncharacterized protein n=1 Tax=Ilex paraguariensis TaxID=185542 RepID=A0ABC8REI0_9AQUA
MRGRSYSLSPPRGYGRRGRSPSPRGRYGGRSRDAPTSLLVRNLRHDCRVCLNRSEGENEEHGLEFETMAVRVELKLLKSQNQRC